MASVEILGGITNTQAVLGAAGLSHGDIPDERLMLSGIGDDLQLHLYSKLPNYEALVAAGEDPSATVPDKMLALAIKNFAKWFLAALLCSRWNAIVQLKTDGKTRADRFDRMDLAAMQGNAEANRDRAWAMIISLLPVDERPTVTPFTPFGISSPTTDPVTDLED